MLYNMETVKVAQNLKEKGYESAVRVTQIMENYRYHHCGS